MRYSIVVPVYKVEEYLEECVRSLISQTFPDFEVILVDDGSPDRCPQMCDDFASQDARIKVIHKLNGGHTSARLAGAESAKGEYIICVDSDDYVDVDLLKKIDNVISEAKPDLVCYGLNKFNGKAVINTTVPMYDEGIYHDSAKIIQGALFDNSIRNLNYGKLIYGMHEKAVKKDIFLKVIHEIPSRITIGEDTVFTMKLLGECNSIFILKYAGYFYRNNPSSIMHAYRIGGISNLLRVKRELQRIDYIDKQEIDGYVSVCLWSLIERAIASSISFEDFYSLIEQEKQKLEGDIAIITDIRIPAIKIRQYLRVWLIKHQKWKAIYMITKK